MNSGECITLRFLGTGTSVGVPVVSCHCPVCKSSNPKDKRLRSSLLISYKEKNVVIDCTPDFRQQMLEAGVDDLEGIVITHEHRDHVGGIDDTRGFNFVKGIPIKIYGDDLSLKSIREAFSYAFQEEPNSGVPELILQEIFPSRNFQIAGLEMIPITVKHHTLDILGFRFGNIAYITDASYIEKSELEKLHQIDVLIINALRIKPHFSHFSLSQTLEVIDKVKPRKAFLTHMSHHIGFHEALEKMLPDFVKPAFDGLLLQIPFRTSCC